LTGRLSGQALAIALEPLSPRTFDKDSPVTAYWLTRCEGFRVSGVRGEAVVEGVVYDEDPLEPVALRVRRGQHNRARTRLLPVDAVEAVCPVQRILYVRRPRSAASRAVGGVSSLGPHGRRATQRTSQGMAAAWRYSAPRAAAASRAGGAAARAQWPWIRRVLAACAQTVYVLGLVLYALVLTGAAALWRRAPGATRRWLFEPLAEVGRRVARAATAARHAHRYARRRDAAEMGVEVLE
jgi:hypothetical protein